LIRTGIGGSYLSFDNVEDKINYTVNGGVVIPTGVFSDRGGVDDAPIFPDANRKVFFAYAQDEWHLAPDWILTTGARFDHYSDFGGTTNPRIALVWNTRHDFTTKLLYGRAFRPPSITELYSNGLLTGKGKRTLEPVTVDTVELSFNYRSLHFQSNINFFWYHENNLIQLIPSASSPNGLEFDNIGSQEGLGMEWEFKWNITQKLSLKGNYAYQSRIDDESDGNVNIRFGPEHQTYIEGNYQYSSIWGLNVNAISVFNRVRPDNDPRPSIDDYSIVNVTLHRKSFAKYFDASFSVRNLFDEDVRDPSGSATTLPFDIPLPGRNIYGQLRASF
jgi:iron complex outermembrane receptor protein